MVEEAIRRLPKGAVFADLCTGSGCIAVSVLAERPDTRAVAVELFAPTMELAIRNAARNGVGERFAPVCADVLASDFCLAEPVDAILSNPPYIPSGQLSSLEPELFAEPRAALDGGADGLLFYRDILQRQAGCLKPDGFFLFEIGYDQADALVTMGRNLGFLDCCVLKDYGGNDRVVSLGSKGA